MKKYIKVWWIYTTNMFQTQFVVARWSILLFLFAKILRFATFTFFLIILLSNTKVLAGYNLDQVILFFLSFNFLDIFSQLLFREVYRFRAAIVTGNFDFYLIKPLNPLFRSLFTGTDLLDLITLIPLAVVLIYFIDKLQLLTTLNFAGYLLMMLVGFLIALSFHILVLSLGVLTTEIDNTVMVYRDLVSMARVPVDIYMEPVRGLITFVIPIGMMMTFPPKTLLGLLSPVYIIYSIIFSVSLLYLSLKIWQGALKRYSSASS